MIMMNACTKYEKNSNYTITFFMGTYFIRKHVGWIFVNMSNIDIVMRILHTVNIIIQ